MDTDPDHLVVQDKLIAEGTSIFLERTREIAWVGEIGDDHVRIETVTESFEMTVEGFESRIVNGDFVLESQPVGYREVQ